MSVKPTCRFSNRAEKIDLITEINGPLTPTEGTVKYLQRLINTHNLPYSLNTMKDIWNGRHWNIQVERNLVSVAAKVRKERRNRYAIDTFFSHIERLRNPKPQDALCEALCPELIIEEKEACWEDISDKAASLIRIEMTEVIEEYIQDGLINNDGSGFTDEMFRTGFFSALRNFNLFIIEKWNQQIKPADCTAN